MLFSACNLQLSFQINCQYRCCIWHTIRLVQSTYTVITVWMWRDVCGQVWCPILGIYALLLSYPVHTKQWVGNMHPEQLAAFFTVARLGVWCLAQEPHLSRGIEGGRERWSFTSSAYNPWRYPVSKPWPLGYKSDSITNTCPHSPNISALSHFMFFKEKDS